MHGNRDSNHYVSTYKVCHPKDLVTTESITSTDGASTIELLKKNVRSAERDLASLSTTCAP